MSIVGIHQPNFMPWIGYFKKISESDKFIFLDSVKCSKNSYFNRNKFSTSKKFDNSFWLSCPIKKDSYKKNLSDVVSSSEFLQKHVRHLKMRHSKTKESEYFKEIIETYSKFSANDHFKVADFNIEIIKLTCSFLDIKTKFFLSSSIDHDQSKSKQLLLIELIKRLEGKKYMSGTGAKAYQQDDLFLKESINLQYCKNVKNKSILINEENVSMIDLILHFGLDKCKKMILA